MFSRRPQPASVTPHAATITRWTTRTALAAQRLRMLGVFYGRPRRLRERGLIHGPRNHVAQRIGDLLEAQLPLALENRRAQRLDDLRWQTLEAVGGARRVHELEHEPAH